VKKDHLLAKRDAQNKWQCLTAITPQVNHKLQLAFIGKFKKSDDFKIQLHQHFEFGRVAKKCKDGPRKFSKFVLY
jgi:hypothetical protein